MAFTWNFDPIIFSVGPFALRWYSLVYVAGFLLGYWLLRRFADDGRIKNLDAEGVEEFMTWLIVGSILCARLVYAFVYNPVYFLAEPLQVLAIWEGGLSFHGGFLGAILVTGWFTRKRNIRFYDFGDLLVIPFSLVLVFGRIANFINGELVGLPTMKAWCVEYPHVEGCRHPSQFYEAAKNLLTFLILLPLYMKEEWRRKLREGTIFWLFFLLYGFGRFLTDFWRAPDPTDPLWGNLILGQWLSLGMALIGVAGLVWVYTQQEGGTEEEKKADPESERKNAKKKRPKKRMTKR